MPLNSNPAELATELTEVPEEANLELRISDCVVRNFYKPGLSVETGEFAQRMTQADNLQRASSHTLVPPEPRSAQADVILSKLSEQRVRRATPYAFCVSPTEL